MESKNARRDLIAKQDAVVKDFLRTLTGIVKAMHNKNKQDSEITEIKELMSIAVKDLPLDTFLQAGQHVWNYRADIAAGNIEAFLKNDYKKEIEGYIEDDSEKEHYSQMVAKIKRTWRFFNAEEQADIVKKVQNMLKQYANYESTKRELEKLKKPAKKVDDDE